ncbi:coproporphyrinogen III oxidase [Paenibacillus anaericanus]|uniref:hypothetical protein n=1 Tax=Paenibacillus anaericanus TaxID=170367 RepID=UPI00277F7899|nr:hypothetical protein [Paenibacillus anaericanus]MDQ0087376.1 coproporphyrinogen III oxidase [Paenibacillus anaericanus]
MKYQGAVVKEQGVNFAIVIVKPQILNSAEREIVRSRFRPYFPLGIPIVLMAQNPNGIPTYHGKQDIVNFLASIDFQGIPWKEYSIG